MAHFTLQIEDIGPLLNVQLSASAPRLEALTRAKKTPRPPFVAKGLVDTGASCTSIDHSVVAALDLSPIGDFKVSTPSTGNRPITVNQYDIGVTIYSTLDKPPMVIPALPVGEFSLINQGFHVLIGRDILAQCMLVYNGPMGQYTLSF